MFGVRHVVIREPRVRLVSCQLYLFSTSHHVLQGVIGLLNILPQASRGFVRDIGHELASTALQTRETLCTKELHPCHPCIDLARYKKRFPSTVYYVGWFLSHRLSMHLSRTPRTSSHRMGIWTCRRFGPFAHMRAPDEIFRSGRQQREQDCDWSRTRSSTHGLSSIQLMSHVMDWLSRRGSTVFMLTLLNPTKRLEDEGGDQLAGYQASKVIRKHAEAKSCPTAKCRSLQACISVLSRSWRPAVLNKKSISRDVEATLAPIQTAYLAHHLKQTYADRVDFC